MDHIYLMVVAGIIWRKKTYLEVKLDASVVVFTYTVHESCKPHWELTNLYITTHQMVAVVAEVQSE